MDLERLSARLRPRKGGEALDLGTLMVREHLAAVYLPWLCTAGVASAVLLSVLPIAWGVFAVWYLLPIFDRVPLFVLSRATFGDVPNLKRVLSEAPRMMFRFLLLPLTIGRLSPWRTFHLPVSELEMQTGKRYFDRCRVLRIEQDMANVGLASMSSIFTYIVWFGLISFIQLFAVSPDAAPAPDPVVWQGFEVMQIESWELVMLALAMLLVEPLRVGSGFALYLNRRQQLEGWDIELIFRSLAARLRSAEAAVGSVSGAGATVPRPARSVGSGLLLFCVCLGSLCASPAAQERIEPLPSAERSEDSVSQEAVTGDPQEVITRVKAHRDFGYETKEMRWQPKNKDEPEACTPSGAGLFGGAFQLIFWCLFLGLAAWLLFVLITRRGPGRGGKGDAGPAPVEVLGLDVRPDSLPDDPAAAAWQLWQDGDAVGCLGMLYRASLARLIHDRELRIKPSATESDCVASVRVLGITDLTSYFGQLTTAWQACAYAHRIPGESVVQQLCGDWPIRFREDAGQQGGGA